MMIELSLLLIVVGTKGGGVFADNNLFNYESGVGDPRFNMAADNTRDMIKSLLTGTSAGTKRSSPSSTTKSLEDITTGTSIDADHTYNVLVVLLQWSNHADRPVPTPGDIEEMWNGIGVGENYKGGSIANWTAVNSHFKWKTHATVVDQWIQLPNTESYYANGRMGFPTFEDDDKFEEAVLYAMNAVEQLGIVNFDDFDQDGDNVLDTVMFIHSGYDAANGQPDCNDSSGQTTTDDMMHSIARNGWNVDWESRSDGTFKTLGNYAVDSAFVGWCDYIINRIGVPTHEFFHTVGLPDLYDLDGQYDPASYYVSGLGAYDIMSSPYGQGNRLKYPGHLSPWCKMEMGWITPVEITNDGTYTVRASAVYEDYYIISEPYEADGEYLLIENRQPLLFDELLWQPGGVVIYHIDDNVEKQDTRGFPGQAGWPQNGNHYRVALLQADGQYDLEKSVNDGHIDDFWSTGQSLGPGPNNHPNTDSYAFGNVARTGITIEGFTETEPGVWSFQVKGLGSGNPSPPTPEPTNPPPPTPEPTDPPPPEPTPPPESTPEPTPPPESTPEPTEPGEITTQSPTQAPSLVNGTHSPTMVNETQAPTTSVNDTNTTEPEDTSSPTTSPTEVPTTEAPTIAPTTAPVFNDSNNKSGATEDVEEEKKGSTGLAIGLSLGVAVIAGMAYVFFTYYYTGGNGTSSSSSPPSSDEKPLQEQDEEEMGSSEEVSESASSSSSSGEEQPNSTTDLSAVV